MDKEMDKFDFEEYINKNSDYVTRVRLADVTDDMQKGERPSIQLSQNNAKIMCEIYKLAEGLK